MQLSRRVLASARVELPRIRSEVAWLRSRVAEREVAGRLVLAGRALSFAMRDVPLVPLGLGTLITLRAGDLPLSLAANIDVLDWVPSLARRRDALAGLDPSALANILSDALADDLHRLEAAFSCHIALETVRRAKPFPVAGAPIALTVQPAGAPDFTAVLLSRTPDALMAALMSTFPPRSARPIPHRRVEAVWLGPVVSMPRAELAFIAAGDTVRLTRAWRWPDECAHLLVAGSHLAPLRAVPGGFVRDGPEIDFEDLIQRTAEGEPMSDPESDRPGSLGDPRTLVTVELDRRDMATSDIERLATGAVLDFDIATVDRVLLCADGLPFAEGRLVQLDDRVGVQITRMI